MFNNIALGVGLGRFACYAAVAILVVSGLDASAGIFVAGMLAAFAARALDDWF